MKMAGMLKMRKKLGFHYSRLFRRYWRQWLWEFPKNKSIWGRGSRFSRRWWTWTPGWIGFFSTTSISVLLSSCSITSASPVCCIPLFGVAPEHADHTTTTRTNGLFRGWGSACFSPIRRGACPWISGPCYYIYHKPSIQQQSQQRYIFVLGNCPEWHHLISQYARKVSVGMISRREI
jgi:hypothetical protein